MLLRSVVHLSALGLGALVAAFLVGPPTVRATVAPIAISALPVPLNRDDPAQQMVGELRFLGGLALQSSHRGFGGLSGALWDPACNRLLAVSDTGAWVVLEPLERDDRLVGIGTAHIATIRDERGQPPLSKADADAEALSMAANGDTLVWFERRNLAQRYPAVSACRPETLDKPASAILAPGDMADWPRNGGPEAAARFRDGQLVIAEDATWPDGSQQGLILAEDGSTRARLALLLPAGYRPTGLALLDEAADGARYLLLTRQFSPQRGVSSRLMLLPVKPDGGRMAPREIAYLKPPLTVDNMEAVAIRKDGERIFIYLLSDDNFNPMQRSILMKFQWVPPPS